MTEAGSHQAAIFVMRFLSFAVTAVMLATLAGCAPDYSPNTYGGNAVQQANKVESAVVVGFRQVRITAGGTVGAVSGGAAGGVLGAQAEPSGIVSALGAVGGTVVGGLVGTTIEHVGGDTTGWEYIVRKSNGDLLSVTQREPAPIPLGQKVLVITGTQARIVPDYSVALDPTPAPATGTDKTGAKETPAAPPLPVAASQPPAIPSSESAAPDPASRPAMPAAATAAPAAASPAQPPTPSSTPQEAAAPPDFAAPPPAASGSETAPNAPPP
jgi:outer membrane lipoprotein SlyB